MQIRAKAALATGATLLLAGASPAAAADWRLAGTTYNSVAFIDMASVADRGSGKTFTALRVSGQPAKDGWKTVVQKLHVDCRTRIFIDAGSVIEQADGSIRKYPGIGASQKAMSSGVFYDMFEILCGGRAARSIADPRAWTHRNFKVGG